MKAARVNFQVTVLKILVSYPDGFAAMEDLKRDMAILATSGQDWTERTKRLGARAPDLDIFSQGLVERISGGRRITNAGRAVLDFMEGRSGSDRATEAPAPEADLSVPQCRILLSARNGGENGVSAAGKRGSVPERSGREHARGESVGRVAKIVGGPRGSTSHVR